jgi:hypothetical protein
MERSRKSAIYTAAIALLAAGLLAAGCGGSGSAAPLKKPQFVREANAICANAVDEREKALSDATKEGSDSEPGQAALVTEVALPPVQKMSEELADLGVPVGDEKEVQAIVKAFERGIATVEKDPTSVNGVIGAFAEASKLAEAYGLTSCAI